MAAIVIDNGSHMCRAGLASDGRPKCTFPTLVGRPKGTFALQRFDKHIDYWVGHAADNIRGDMLVKRPIESGHVTNWDDMDRVWNHIFKNLKIDPADHPVLMTEMNLENRYNRQRMVQNLFEFHNASSVFVSPPAVLALYASGLTTGVVLDCGNYNCFAVPIYRGHALPYCTHRSHFGGRELTDHLERTLSQSGFYPTTNGERRHVGKIKDTLCYVALDFEKEKNSVRREEYRLPDGRTIEIRDQLISIPEGLFEPKILGLELEGVHEIIYNAVMRCDNGIRENLFSNIVLSGGCTMFPGFVERMQKELTILKPSAIIVENLPSQRDESTYIGGTCLTSLSTFQHMCITKEEYEETGPNMAIRKCF